MPASSSSTKRGGLPEVASLKSKQREINKYQTLATMNNNNNSNGNMNYQKYHQQQQTMSAAAMMTNYHQQQQQQQQQRHHNYHMGSQTISRSNNLHKQFYTDPRVSVYAQQAAAAAAASGYYFYDQPNYQAQMYPNPQHQHRVPYAPMSLAVRSPKERGAIPSGPLMANYPMANGHFTRTLGRPSSCHVKQQQHHQQQKIGVKDPAANVTGSPEAAVQPLTSARLIYQEPTMNLLSSHLDHQARLNKPLCRCRVMYLGSSVPHITKNGLHGIQEPLRHLYPEEQFNSSNLRTTTATGKQENFGSGGSTTSGGGGSGQPPTKISNTIDISHLSSSLGIDSWLSVWSNGLLLENVDEFGREMRRFYSIESLHYCAAVRFFDTTTLMKPNSSGQQQQQQNMQKQSNGSNAPGDDNNNNNDEISSNNNSNNNVNDQHEASPSLAAKSDANNNNCNYTIADNGSSVKRGVVRFLPLDAPIFQYPGMLDANHPPVFAAIMRRTSGIKVLECHAFICRRDAAANALVRCCTHAYSDFLSAKRLSANFGLLQQQQLSAYIGNSGINAFVSNNTDLEHDQRTQTMPNGRRFQSTSAGRHLARHQRTPLGPDSGQYQVIDAVVQHHDGAGNNRRSKASSKLLDGHRHHHGAGNSTGTNSNELTHSDDNDLNSRDDTDDEDNYAIITKRKQHQALEPQEVAPTARTSASRVKETGASRRRTRKIKGSSKSLFNDFMPQECGPGLMVPLAGSGADGATRADQIGGDHAAIERLSHSLDYLQMVANQTGGSKRIHSKSYNKSYDEPGAVGHETNITYSVVTDDKRNKRHSKSMQDLQQIKDMATRPSGSGLHELGEQHQMANGFGRRRSSGRGSKYQPLAPHNPIVDCVDCNGHSVHRQRKAASYQDILRQQQPPPPPPPRDSPPSSFGSLARRHSSRNSSVRSSLASTTASRSRRTSRRRRSGGATESISGGLDATAQRNANGQGGSQHELRQCSLISSSDANNRIYATCLDDDSSSNNNNNNSNSRGPSPNGELSDLRVLRPDYCDNATKSSAANQPGDRTSGHKSRSRHKSQPIDAPPSGYYNHMAPTSGVPLYGPVCSPGPMPQAPIYMPAYYMQPDQQQPVPVPVPVPIQTQQGPIYGPGSLYDTITPPPGSPYVSLPYHSGQYHQHQVPLLSPMALHQRQHQQHQLTAGYAMAPPPIHDGHVTANPPNTKGSISGACKNKSSKSTSAKAAHTLATRFRCLSPPVNFFSSSSSATGSVPKTGDEPARASSGQGPSGNGRPVSIGSQVDSLQASRSHDERLAASVMDSARVQQRQQQQQRQSVASNFEADCSTPSSGLVSPVEVVSGRPGFVSQRGEGAHSATNGAARVSSASTKRDKGPRMSWIKRLSMTLSSGHSGAGAGGSAGPPVIVVDPAGQEGRRPDDSGRCGGDLGPPVRSLSIDRQASGQGASSPPLSDLDKRDELTRIESEAEAGPANDGNASDLNNCDSSGAPIEAAPVLHDTSMDASRPSVSGGADGDGGDQQQKPKRKRGGLFSGVLTLGRSSGAKQAREKRAASGT